MGKTEDLQEAARAALGPAVSRTLLASTAIQEAVLRARSNGASREEWILSAAQTWDAIEKAWGIVEARVAASLEVAASGATVLPISIERTRRALEDHAGAHEADSPGACGASCPTYVDLLAAYESASAGAPTA